MAQPKHDGGPAFPKPYSTDEHKDQCNVGYEEQGMSLRAYFAGQALAGMLYEPNALTGTPDVTLPLRLALTPTR